MNYNDPQNGQTLFEFLKRKKKVALQQSLSSINKARDDNRNNFNNRQGSSLSKSFIANNQNDLSMTPANQTRRSNIYQSTFNQNNILNSKTRRESSYFNINHNNHQNITPKRVKFLDSQRQKENSQRSISKKRKSSFIGHNQTQNMNQKQERSAKSRSFIDLISPYKKNNQRSPTPQNNFNNNNYNSRLSNNNQKVKSGKEHYSRKNLNNSIKLLKDTLHNYIEAGNNIKSKAHSIFIQIKPILKFVQDNADQQEIYRKSQQLKLKLRTFESMFKTFDVQNSSSTIQNFHRSLSQHLDTIQGELRQQYEKKDINHSMKIRQTKDNKIQSLQEQNRKLQKQFDILNRKLQKLSLQKQQLQIKFQEKQQQFNKTLSQKINQYHQKLKSYEQQIQKITSQLSQSQLRQKQLNKKLKDAQYLKDQHQRQFRQETQSIVSSKQQYLLNQIMMLKKQFQTDMAQITTLYNNKQADNLTTIRSLQRQVEQLLNFRQQDKIYHQNLLQQCNLAKVTSNKLKKQNDCLVTDMTRMNQQLYQHWLALKDIKTLSTRLQVFGKFTRIYDDLAFNDHLFG